MRGMLFRWRIWHRNYVPQVGPIETLIVLIRNGCGSIYFSGGEGDLIIFNLLKHDVIYNGENVLRTNPR